MRRWITSPKTGRITPFLLRTSKWRQVRLCCRTTVDLTFLLPFALSPVIFRSSKWARRRYDIRRQTIQRSFGQRPTIGRSDLLKQRRRR